MAYDDTLAGRVRAVLASHDDIEEIPMFGGLTFMLGGHMCCGIAGGELFVRLGRKGAAEAVTKPHAHFGDFIGRPMKTIVSIAPEGFETDGALGEWIQEAVAFAAAQPPKNQP